MPLPGITYHQHHHHYYYHRHHHHLNAPHAKIIVQQITRRVLPKRPRQTTRVHYQLVPNHWKETDMAQVIIVISVFIIIFNITNTRSYAALRAADLDWIVGPGYSPGGYILGCSQRLASCLRHSAQVSLLQCTFPLLCCVFHLLFTYFFVLLMYFWGGYF